MKGPLLYFALRSRPDILLATMISSPFQTSPTMFCHQAAKPILRYSQGTANLSLKCTSTIKIGNAVCIWGSRKHPIVSMSTCDAEYHAITLAEKEVVWIQQVILESGLAQSMLLFGSQTISQQCHGRILKNFHPVAQTILMLGYIIQGTLFGPQVMKWFTLPQKRRMLISCPSRLVRNLPTVTWFDLDLNHLWRRSVHITINLLTICEKFLINTGFRRTWIRQNLSELC